MNSQIKLNEEVESTLDVSSPQGGFQGKDMFQSIQELVGSAMSQPETLYKHIQSFNDEYLKILQGTSEIKPDRKDRRFTDPFWMESPYYRVTLQTYLSATRSISDWIEETQEDKADKMRAEFLMTLLTEAASPSNSILNPTVLKRLYETQGGSFATGMLQMAEDSLYGGGMPSSVDKGAFKVGENLATTEGAVVYRSERFELIQYKPQTEKVLGTPVLNVPPQINKYYGLDLTPKNSLMSYMANNQVQGFTVSWRNPGAEHREWGFADYVLSAVEAIDVVREICGSDSVNIFSSCAGAMTAASAIAYLNATGGADKVSALTLAAYVLDAEKSQGLLGLFATKESSAMSKAGSAMKGYLDGEDMARIFSWLRPNDLVWSFFVNNYLCGNKPPAFDLLYWNSDTTRLPAQFHADLIDIFADNLLANGQVEVNGVMIDLGKVTQDAYVIAGATDHITPWKGVYHSSKVLGGKVHFVLSNSGHIQSIINPPGNPKAQLFSSDEFPDDPDAWYKGSSETRDSWWGNWVNWLGEHSTGLKPAPESLGSKKYGVIEAAPGSYVQEK
ncbi:MAG: alpha/beta fold hydrolase [Endozoicomonas sp.]